jgi:DNA primase
MALSDYFIRELSSRSDIKTVDGRAQFAEAAKPLVARIPEGVYRELLIDALAKVVGMSPDRMLGLMGSKLNEAPSTSHGERRPPSQQPASNVSGRSNLVRQAVHLLVHFPQAAASIVNPEGLRVVDRKGVPLLMELINSLQANPCASTGALLERWRDKPDYTALSRLAALECLVPDAKGAAREVNDALQRLTEEDGPKRRTDELLSKAGRMPLTEAESLELQGLLAMKRPTRPSE